MNWLGRMVAKEIEPTDTVLDLGCGNLITTGRLGAIHLAVDAFLPYLDAIKASGPTMLSVLPGAVHRFPDKSYDVVLLLDVIEHLPEECHEEVILGAERIARKRVMVYSPEGMMPQEAWDAWDLGYNEYQRHVSATSAGAFEPRGYAITKHTSKNDNGIQHETFLAIKRL